MAETATVAGQTRYDAVAYPATVFSATHPERLATIARLHGLVAPPVETARVLEIGGGDGVNLIGMAAAYPNATFYNFDLSAAAIARGAALIRATGLTNIRMEVGDILDAVGSLEGPFEYVIAHGVYAWVPEHVRPAVMQLIGRVLAPEGIAFISYNALPGGHLRRVIRDLLFHHVGHIEDPVEKMQRAHDVLLDFGRARENDRPVMAGMREVARPMMRQQIAVLYHDELGGEWHPQALSDVVATANAAGLAFLNDASPALAYDGLPGNDDDDAAIVRAAQTSDFGSMIFFHQTLLVRAGRRPSRRLVVDAMRSLFVASSVQRLGPDIFKFEQSDFVVGDADLADTLEMLGKVWPRRVPIADLAATDDALEALFKLWTAEVVTLHAVPLPGTAEPGARPLASPLARAQIAIGQQNIYTLDHRVIAMEAAGPRAFLALLDGSRDRAQLATDWAASGHGDEVDVDAALRQLAAAVLILA